MNPMSLVALVGKLQRAVAGVLGIDKSQISVFFPIDRLRAGLGEELICYVDGLILNPEGRPARTKEVQDRVADAIKSELKIFVGGMLPNCSMGEVFVRPFDHGAQGFAEWHRPEAEESDD
ncbi:MAG: hypothetical protein ABIA47_03325 [bacterium]